MVTVKLQEPLWKNFVTHAQKARRKPDTVLRQLMRDYIQQVEDEELLAESIRAARRSGCTIEEAEAMIKRIRREIWARKRKNGRS